MSGTAGRIQRPVVPNHFPCDWSRTVMADAHSIETLWQRVKARCVWVGDCFIWQGSTNGKGYGEIRTPTTKLYTHRIAYEFAYGPIPDGLELDHVATRGCTSTSCCNAAHLEAVTHRENIKRWHARKTHCPSGHELVGANLLTGHLRRGWRSCRTCANIRKLADYHRLTPEQKLVRSRRLKSLARARRLQK